MENDVSRQPLRPKAEVVRREKPCPPHGPILVEVVENRAHKASCLACGLEGPEREDRREAELAFAAAST
jgi:hypothetical protein